MGMPLSDNDCPHCGEIVHTDGLIDGVHYLGCEKELPDEMRW